MKLGMDEIMAVIDKVKDTGLTGFVYRDEDVLLKVKNKYASPKAGRSVSGTADERQEKMAEAKREDGSKGSQMGNKPEEEHAGTGDPSSAEEFVTVDSPMVGTFYAAASEKAEPFVQVGDVIQKGQTVGIVEAMKLMSEIEAECAGTVTEILAENGQMVEYGQPLMRVRRDG